MTTQITTPTDDDAFQTDSQSFSPNDPRDRRATGSAGAQMMFSPTSAAQMGQFDTEADEGSRHS